MCCHMPLYATVRLVVIFTQSKQTIFHCSKIIQSKKSFYVLFYSGSLPSRLKGMKSLRFMLSPHCRAVVVHFIDEFVGVFAVGWPQKYRSYVLKDRISWQGYILNFMRRGHK